MSSLSHEDMAHRATSMLMHSPRSASHAASLGAMAGRAVQERTLAGSDCDFDWLQDKGERHSGSCQAGEGEVTTATAPAGLDPAAAAAM